MNTTICGVDDRILYVIITWSIVSMCSRVYEAWLARKIAKLKMEIDTRLLRTMVTK